MLQTSTSVLPFFDWNVGEAETSSNPECQQQCRGDNAIQSELCKVLLQMLLYDDEVMLNALRCQLTH